VRHIYSVHYTLARANDVLEDAYATGDILPGERPQIERRTAAQLAPAGYTLQRPAAFIITIEN
jgi:hypothetical protein